MCKRLEEEIKELKAEVAQEAERANTWRSLWDIQVAAISELLNVACNTKVGLSDARSDLAYNGDIISELRATLSNTKAELSDTRLDLGDITRTLDKCRALCARRGMAINDLRKSVSDLEDTICRLTEERDVSREMLQSLSTAYDDLSVLYAKNCDV